MFLLEELTLPAPQQLALDEVLLLEAESHAEPVEYLRLWELDEPAAILGRGSRWNEEVNVSACRGASVPVLRRCSGGAAIIGGPGCLFYSVVLNRSLRPELNSIDGAHQFVLSRLDRALKAQGVLSQLAGTSDVAIATDEGMKKVSGNSLRLRRDYLLYHGTVLYAADLSFVQRLLRTPPRQPDYRQGRAHEQFICNIAVDGESLREALLNAWRPWQAHSDWPLDRCQELAAKKYATAAWTERL